MAYYYRVYGLAIRSEIELPELMPLSEERCDVDIRFRPVKLKPTTTDSNSWGCYRATSKTANLYYPQAGYFEISKGKRITVEAKNETDPAIVRRALLSVAMGIVLDQRGHLTLRASGVRIDGEAIAFIGDRHRGKTTTAAAFYAQGYPIITDDTIVLDAEDERMVLPGYPQLMLRAETVAEAPGVDERELKDFMGERKIKRADEGFDPSPVPLRHIYLLEWGDTVGTEAISLRDGFLLLVQHSYALRFLGKAGATAKHFTRINQLVHSIPIFRLTKPRSLKALPDVVEAVEQHLASTRPVQS